MRPIHSVERLVDARSNGEPCGSFAADAYTHVVVHALARHLGIAPEAIDRSADLRDDLGMTSLDLQLVVLRLEHIARIEFPSATTVLVRTAGDLEDLFRAAARRTTGRD